MTDLKYAVIRTAFEVLALPGISALVRNNSPARGVVFTLHRVLPEAPAAFAPNAILQVTPDFLDYALLRVRHLGLDIVNLDEAVARLDAPNGGRPFVVLTFDDGYRDNLVHALPVLKRHEAPFTLYLPTGLIDGAGEVWWQALEDIVAASTEVTVTLDGATLRLPTASSADKQAAYTRIYWHMRRVPEPERVGLIKAMASDARLDLGRHCRDLIMGWDELSAFAGEPLCTIGAHTVRHHELAKLPEAEARDEIGRSLDVIEARLGQRPSHLSYPIGGHASAGPREYALARELGLRTAVTTLPGGLYADHAKRLTALPRISLNGRFQARRFVDVFATGAIFTRLGAVMK